jgi:hypothetical protein
MEYGKDLKLINEFENTDFKNQYSDYFSGCSLFYNKNNGKLKAINIISKYLNKKTKKLNPLYIDNLILNKKEKLELLSLEIEFTTFLTLTTKKEVKELNKFYDKIRRKYLSLFDLNYIKLQHKTTTKNSLLILEKNIEKYIKLEIKEIIKKQIYLKSFFNIASLKNKYFNKISDYKFKKQCEEKFKQKYKLEIKIEFEKIFDFEFEKRLKNKTEIIEFEKIFKYRLNKNLNSALYYFKVLEFQKNLNPHFHILLNKYIPISLINEISKEENYIFRVDFIIDNYLQNKKNDKILSSKLSSKYSAYEKLKNSNSFKNSKMDYLINYILKYVNKDFQTTFDIKEKLNLNKIHITEFSKSCHKDFKEIFKIEKSDFKKIGFTKQFLKTSKIELIENENIKKNNFLDYLNKNNLFNCISNEKFFEIENKFIKNKYDWIKKYQLNKNNLKIFEENNFEFKLDLYKQLRYKNIVYEILSGLNNTNTNLKISKELKEKSFFDFKEDEIKLNCFSVIEKSNLLLIKGFAGCGKTYLLEFFNNLNSNEFQVLYLTKKKTSIK